MNNNNFTVFNTTNATTGCSGNSTTNQGNHPIIRRIRRALPLRNIEIIERPDGEDVVIHSLQARTLRQVFFIVQSYKPFHYVFLYWQNQRLDPFRNFAYYRMGHRLQFYMETESVTGGLVSCELDSDDASSDSSFEMVSPTLQAGKSFEEILTVVDEYEPFVKLIEDICALIYQFKRSKSIHEASVALGCFMRSATGRANVYVYRDLAERFYNDFKTAFSVQSDGHWVNSISDFYDNYSRCKNSELSNRLKSFFNHLIMHCVYHKLGIEVDVELFDKLERNKIRPSLIDCISFMDACTKLLVFLLKQGRQVMLTGDVEHFFIDSDSTSVWTMTAKKLKMQSEFLGNPSAVNMDIHTYLSDLSQCISEGKSLVKYMKTNTLEGKFFSTILFELIAIENRYLSITAAQALRKAPLGIIVYGHSSIGKSSVMSVLSDFDARRRKRNTDKGFVFTFTAESEFLDNFTSSMHTIIIDDAAIHNPAKIQGVDPTIAYIMRICNMVAWCPPQAAIENKGKTPMLVNLCLISTNVADLNIPIYYRASYAAMRRLKYRIEPIVRPEYTDIDGITLCSAKCGSSEGYPDYWSFKVFVAVRKANMLGDYEHLHDFPDMKSFLAWFGKISDIHDAEQERALKNSTAYNIELCGACSNPVDMCLCERSEVQGYKFCDNKIVYANTDGYNLSEEQTEESKFLEAYLLRNGNLDLFREVTAKVKKWRTTVPNRKKSRLYNTNASVTFMAKFTGKTEDLYLDYYAYEELPSLLTGGWSDTEIIHDFYNFTVFVKEHTDINDLLDISRVFVERNITLPSGNIIGSLTDAFFKILVTIYFYSKWFRSTVIFFGKFHFIRTLGMNFLRPCLLRTENQKFFAKKVGKAIDEKLGGNNRFLKTMLAFLAFGSITAIAWKFWRTAVPNVVHKEEQLKQPLVDDPEDDNSLEHEEVIEPNVEQVETNVQVLRSFGKLPEQAEGDNVVNPWLAPERSVTTIDFVPNLCRDLDGLERKLARNSLVFEAKQSDEGGVWKYTGILTVLSNEHFLTNSHSIPSNGDVEFVVYMGHKGRVSPKLEFSLKQNQIERILSRDIAIITTKNFPAVFSDISRNFVKNTYNGVYDGFYLRKNLDGSTTKITVLNIRKCHLTRTIEGLFFDMECFSGVAETPTIVGDCGSPLVAVTGYGPVILGYHVILDVPNVVYATKFSHEDFKHFSKEMVVQVGKIPVDEGKLAEGPKSYVDFHEDGNIAYHGELLEFRARPKHHVVASELASQIYGKILNGQLLEERLYGPIMDAWRAQQTNLKEFMKPVKNMDESVLKRTKDLFVQYILKHLPEAELKLIAPHPLDVAVNGYPGMAYVDGIKRSTSMGFPYRSTKRKFLLPLLGGIWDDGVKFTPEVEKRIADWMKLLAEGVRLHAVFSANLKDEPVSRKKLDEWKTRVFFSCPVELLVIVRMFFLGFSRVVQRNRDLFWVAVGLDTTSPQWEKLFQRLSKFGIKTTVAGDHVFYDKKVKMLLLNYVMEAIIEICIASGNFNEEHIKMMEVLKHELMNPSVDFFGMLITLFGGEVSGHQITTIFNCIMNIFYLIYAWVLVGYDIELFFDKVVGVVLGDDHIVCVDPDYPLYNHTSIKKILEDIGLGYTMADKSSDSRPYIVLNEAPFLKRSFKYDVNLGLHVGQLEFNSIIKMLTVQVRSKDVMLSTQLAQSLCSANNEMFFYGEEKFDEFRDFVSKLKKSDSLQEQMRHFPMLSYDALKRRFWKSVENKAYSTGLQSQKSYIRGSYCAVQHSVPDCIVRMDRGCFPARAFPKMRFYASVELDTKRNCTVVTTELLLLPDNLQLSKTNEQMNAIISETPATEGSESSNSQQTQFINESVSEKLMLGTEHDHVADSLITNAHLGEFLSRPTKIFSWTWTENLAPGSLTSFLPWNLFFNNANIRNKLEGFGFIRCKLHLKFTINASQFYYGSIGAFYTPMNGYVADTTGVSSGYAPGIQVLQSQKPHVMLDPQTTSTSEMELPFLFNKHFLNASSLIEFTNMGRIDMTQFAALRSANGVSTAGVTIVVYAWASDLEMTALTSRAVLQSKREYVGNGQISGPASTVASVAKAMTKIPVIGPFAKATEMAAGTIGGIASMFGFTNVPNVKDVEPVKPTSFHTLASSEISEPINKLSLQPKQEISVDSSYTGDIYKDPLHIANFCARESFLCGSLWTTSSPEDTVMFTTHVTPQLYEKSAGTNYTVYNVPMAHVANLFDYWRGDLIFRFKVIKTQYHRGRLNISWDPVNNSAASMPGYGNPRVQNILFDLDETDTVEVVVPYMQPLSFTKLRDGSGGVGGPYWSNGPSPTLTAANGTTNGTLQVRVVNRLTAPEASSDVDILVYVRAADNIEFASPSEIKDKTLMVLQSKVEYVLGEKSISHSDAYNEVFGEKITSMRQLLHRQSKVDTEFIPRGSNWNGAMLYATFPFQRMPRAYGYTSNGLSVATSTLAPPATAGFNFTRVHPITWLQACFVGVKGSTNWTFNVENNNGKWAIPVNSVSICRNPEPTSNKPFIAVVPATLSNSQLSREHNNGANLERQGAQGMALTNQITQSGISVNLPYYSRYKFQVNNLAKSHDLSDSVSDEKNLDWYELTIKRGVVPATTDVDVAIDAYVGTGPDFDFVFFLNCPVYTYLITPAASAVV